ncbi:MAG: efflux RND transporter permease subunit [Parvularculaceae bacterium]
MKLGVSGTLARAFINSPLTPLILLASLAMGLLALASIPREEEPQISVPLIDVHIRAEGLRAPDAVELVTKPLEIILKGVDDVEHVYSQTVDNGAVVTARFKVGIDADDAILRVHEKIRANISDIPVDIPEPVVVGRGINDVPVVTLTLSPSPQASDHWNDNQLYKIAERLREELVKTEDVGLSFIVGGRADQIRIEPDPERLALYGVTLQQLAGKVRGANRSFESGSIRLDGGSVVVEVGQTLEGPVDIGLLLLTTRDGRPVYINDVARVVYDVAQSEHRVWTLRRDHAFEPLPAVTLAFGKRKGANAVLVAESLLERLETLDGSLIPDGVDVAITRNYGETASEKSNELLFHLALATGSIVLLIIFVIGWREGLVTLVIIPTTILLTLFASNLLGYTINRVSLFALIFSIGILVDDAIVVIENIARHWAMGDDRTRASAAVDAVAEVGNPTIVATATVVVALLPMLFVSGLMGPYMAPIPINASAAMIFSFFVAVVVTPWLMMRFASRAPTHHGDTEGALGRFYRRAARPIIASRKVARRFLIGVALATVVAVSFFGFKFVTVKLLPFDNKSEFQVVVDLPEGSSLEETERVLLDAATRLEGIEEITSVQIYAGTAAPFNFNGLVRHYYLRASQELGDIQVNLEAKHHRKRSSHAIALEARELLHGVATPNDTSIKIVEVPPGPPVLSTLLAEVYGPDAQSRRKAAEIVRELYRKVAFIVDDDVAMGGRPPRVRISIDQDSLEFYQVDQNDVYETLDALLHGARVGYSHRGEGRDPVEIVVSLPKEDLVWTERLLSTPVPANTIPGARGVVELGDVVRVSKEQGSHVIFRRDGRFAEMVMGELAGAYEAPIYGMLAVQDEVKKFDWAAAGLTQPNIKLYGQPVDESGLTLLWDGEWEITWVTFRDMGAAFMVAIVAIYVLVVAQFGSFRLPLVILTPVPLTLIGIMLGHWLFKAQFTATSMIGFIALAGIIVRNSILLVDFIRHSGAKGASLRETLLEAGAVRFKPILLTAIAAMIGASVILFDPIFQGLAISLLFGLASSTALTLLVIPAIYIVARDDGVMLE